LGVWTVLGVYIIETGWP